jgi:hypothetical protein
MRQDLIDPPACHHVAAQEQLHAKSIRLIAISHELMRQTPVQERTIWRLVIVPQA